MAEDRTDEIGGFGVGSIQDHLSFLLSSALFPGLVDSNLSPINAKTLLKLHVRLEEGAFDRHAL